LDNIFAVSSIGLYFLYITGNIHNNTLLYISFMIAILAQEKDPWNINYTIGPIIIIALLGICANIYYGIGIPKFRRDYVLKGNLFLIIGSYFFVKGLDEHTDYLRLYHGIWHVFLGISSYYNMNSVIEEHFKPLHQV
jgi:predicted membrane channel-forming protein YqfA (hemolysin III family)